MLPPRSVLHETPPRRDSPRAGAGSRSCSWHAQPPKLRGERRVHSGQEAMLVDQIVHSERSEESASLFTGCTDSSSSLRGVPVPTESTVQSDRNTIHLKRPTAWDT